MINIRLMKLFFYTISILLIGTFATIKAERFYVNNPLANDTVLFASSAKLEFIEGKTTNIKGYFDFDRDNKSNLSGEIRVDLRTLRTGIELRDEHMRDRHLQTEKYPFATIRLKSQKGLPETIENDSLYSCIITGIFTIHDVEREIEIESDIVFIKNGNIKVVSKFSILLDDYNIPRPKALFLKLAKQIDLTIKYTASPKYEPVQF